MTLVDELRHISIKKFFNIIDFNKKLLNVNIIYFNKEICGISKYDKILIDHNNNCVSFSKIKGSDIIKMIELMEKGEIHGWIEFKEGKCKVKPKIKIVQ